MDTYELISVDDIMLQLKDLANDRISFFSNDGDDEIFRQDYHTLMKAIQLLEKLNRLYNDRY